MSRKKKLFGGKEVTQIWVEPATLNNADCVFEILKGAKEFGLRVIAIDAIRDVLAKKYEPLSIESVKKALAFLRREKWCVCSEGDTIVYLDESSL